MKLKKILLSVFLAMNVFTFECFAYPPQINNMDEFKEFYSRSLKAFSENLHSLEERSRMHQDTRACDNALIEKFNVNNICQVPNTARMAAYWDLVQNNTGNGEIWGNCLHDALNRCGVENWLMTVYATVGTDRLIQFSNVVRMNGKAYVLDFIKDIYENKQEPTFREFDEYMKNFTFSDMNDRSLCGIHSAMVMCMDKNTDTQYFVDLNEWEEQHGSKLGSFIPERYGHDLRKYDTIFANILMLPRYIANAALKTADAKNFREMASNSSISDFNLLLQMASTVNVKRDALEELKFRADPLSHLYLLGHYILQTK